MTCAYAVRVALKKFSGTESVDVSLSKGLATVKLKPGNSIRPQEFWDTIRKNGFTTKATRVTVRGEIMAGASQLKVSGTGQILGLKPDANQVAAVKAAVGKTVVLEGGLMPGKDPKAPVPLQVQSVHQ